LPTTAGQSSHPTLISGPTSDSAWFVLAPKSLRGGTLETGATYKNHLRSEPASLTTIITNFRLILDGSQVFPNSIGRISFTRPCPWHRGETVVN